MNPFVGFRNFACHISAVALSPEMTTQSRLAYTPKWGEMKMKVIVRGYGRMERIRKQHQGGGLECLRLKDAGEMPLGENKKLQNVK